MKTLIALSAIALFSFAASATPISLEPGSTVVIDGQVIACQGPSEAELAPSCSIRQDGSRYRVYSGDNVVDTYYSFDDALEAATKLKAAGLCR